MSSVSQVASSLVAFCRQGQFEKAQKELFSDDVISIEPEASQGFEKETRGLPAIIEKGHQFDTITEKIHGIRVSEPLIAGNTIAFTLSLDATMKGRERSTIEELCVYQVKEGKIISEQFYM